jgi:hypothetical protein
MASRAAKFFRPNSIIMMTALKYRVQNVEFKISRLRRLPYSRRLRPLIVKPARETAHCGSAFI